MCTVIFLPTEKNILFSSNRDENPFRPLAIKPALLSQDTIKMICPIDAQAGGTWVGVNENGYVFILLNGAYEKHKPTGDYIKSRGLIVRDLLSNMFPILKWRVTNLVGVEPFTIVAWCGYKLYELVWDGDIKYTRQLSARQPYIWSSSTLYDKDAKGTRIEKFNDWLSTSDYKNKTKLVDFLKSYTDKDNGFIMNRKENLRTLSISTIEIFKDKALFNYNDLMNCDETTIEMSLN